MPNELRPGSADEARGIILIAAVSGRALAASARQSGYCPMVADLFGDLDTRTLATASVAMRGRPGFGFSRAELLAALDRLAAGASVVTGPGFEDRPALLRAVAGHHTLLGNSASVMARAKDPAALSGLCARLGIAHPRIRWDAAPDDGWLRKRIGGAGGQHVRAARPGRIPGRGRYLQQRRDGRALSALFLADGHATRVLGFSEQWADPAPARPFRYGGAVRPAHPPAAAAMAACVAGLAAALGLVGLNSADFLVRADDFDLLEINPRPGATVDIFPGGDVFHLHVQACRGRLPDAVPDFAGAMAAATVYAPQAGRLPSGFAWPDWAADRQPPDTGVAAGAPLCTVLAEADDAEAARALAQDRARSMLAEFQI